MNSTFTKNIANYGGAIRSYYSDDGVLENVVFEENQADNHGGAMYNEYSDDGMLDNVVLQENEA